MLQRPPSPLEVKITEIHFYENFFHLLSIWCLMLHMLHASRYTVPQSTRTDLFKTTPSSPFRSWWCQRYRCLSLTQAEEASVFSIGLAFVSKGLHVSAWSDVSALPWLLCLHFHQGTRIEFRTFTNPSEATVLPTSQMQSIFSYDVIIDVHHIVNMCDFFELARTSWRSC